jgi:hypothetical protein
MLSIDTSIVIPLPFLQSNSSEELMIVENMSEHDQMPRFFSLRITLKTVFMFNDSLIAVISRRNREGLSRRRFRIWSKGVSFAMRDCHCIS